MSKCQKRRVIRGLLEFGGDLTGDVHGPERLLTKGGSAHGVSMCNTKTLTLLQMAIGVCRRCSHVCRNLLSTRSFVRPRLLLDQQRWKDLFIREHSIHWFRTPSSSSFDARDRCPICRVASIFWFHANIKDWLGIHVCIFCSSSDVSSPSHLRQDTRGTYQALTTVALRFIRPQHWDQNSKCHLLCEILNPRET